MRSVSHQQVCHTNVGRLHLVGTAGAWKILLGPVQLGEVVRLSRRSRLWLTDDYTVARGRRLAIRAVLQSLANSKQEAT